VPFIGRAYGSKGQPIVDSVSESRREGLTAIQVQGGKVKSLATSTVAIQSVWAIARAVQPVNLVCSVREVLLDSREYVTTLLDWADNLGFQSVVVHTGAAPDSQEDTRRRLVGSVRSILRGYDGEVTLLLENGISGAASLASIASVVGSCDDPRVGISLNLGNAFAAGYTAYDLANLSSQHVGVVQLSLPDADTECGSRRGMRGSLRNCAWQPEEIHDLLAYWTNLPIIVHSDVQSDTVALAMLASGFDNAVRRDSDLATDNRHDNDVRKR
jgi:endonuclease IV